MCVISKTDSKVIFQLQLFVKNSMNQCLSRYRTRQLKGLFLSFSLLSPLSSSTFNHGGGFDLVSPSPPLFCWFCLNFLVLFYFFLSPDLDLWAFFSRSSSRYENLNSPNLVLILRTIIFRFRCGSLITFSGIQYSYALSLYKSSTSSFSGDRRSFVILLNYEDLPFQMLNMCLLNLLWLSFVWWWCLVETRRTLLASNVVITGEGIFSVCSSLKMIWYPKIGCRICCLTNPFLCKECVLNPTRALLILLIFLIWPFL